ncbi:DUF624 domain-containing protein [Arthrobacter sp. CJ23]|uniref:DUF624 domain-containing protein n=1 Tax=Arthrobacter sp. CJ23 TaxID=2972479 RepID=UPI00215CF85D|nr:DUF624 domain-containing protein [Arthrobacter sp. CJ23]UVJ38989.1 hypothetical protein NVV90_17520 [Arthrobacter sp. CJ23]
MKPTGLLGGLYRACSIYSALAWISVLWLLGSLLLVTLPMATVALHDAAARLLDGEAPTWRRFVRTMKENVGSSWIAFAVVALPGSLAWALLGISRSGAGPMAAGAGMALVAVTAMILAVAPHACLKAAGDPVSVIRWTAYMAMARPIRAILAVVPWVAMTAVVAFCPPQIIIVVAAVAISIPALGSVAVMKYEWATAPRGARRQGIQAFSNITSKGIMQ